MNADKPEAGEAAHPMTGVPQKRLARNCRLEDLRHSPGTWLVQELAQAYRCGKTRNDERLRTVSAVGDKHGPQADRKRDAPNHLYLTLARASSVRRIVGALSAARARGRLRSPIKKLRQANRCSPREARPEKWQQATKVVV